MDIENLKIAKQKSGLTYDEIAKRSGLSKRTIAGFFSNDPKYSNPSIATLNAIEKALGLNQPSLEWTEEEQALGVGRHQTYLSDKEKELIEIGSEILRIHGEQYYNTVITMLKALIK